MIRKFSVPYNFSNPEKYLDSISPFKENIDHLYFSIPVETFSYTEPISNNLQDILDAKTNTETFLEESKGEYKRVLAYNNAFWPMSDTNKMLWVQATLAPLIKKYNIEGIIISDFTLGQCIHHSLPDLEIHTSCNTFQFNLNTMRHWKEQCGVTLFNPPRETLRIPSLLKQIHKLGYKTKYLVNEPCLFGCPQQINHACYTAVRDSYRGKCESFCDRPNKDMLDVFKSNVILPRWLPKLDPYVDVYKLAGRNDETSRIVRALDAYINERDDLDLLDFINNHKTLTRYVQLGLKIPTKMIPDKLLTCQCSQCDTCTECQDSWNNILQWQHRL